MFMQRPVAFPNLLIISTVLSMSFFVGFTNKVASSA
jgi:hypothetical protein